MHPELTTVRRLAEADAAALERFLAQHTESSMFLRSTLQAARLHGVQRAILFTDNPPAVKAYEAIGFRRCGSYRLALLRAPAALRT